MFQPNNEYFITIAECGSVTKAAEKLFVSQPSLSQYLKRLERLLGIELFDHHTSPLKLTLAGERYYAHACAVRRMDENIRRELQDIKTGLTGRLRLGVAFWRGACLLPDFFPTFHARYPGIRIELTEGSAAVVEKALMDNKIDVAVLNLPKNVRHDKLTSETICEESILLAAPYRHPRIQQILKEQNFTSASQIPQDFRTASLPRISLDILRTLPLLLTKSGQNLTYAVQSALEQYQIRPDILLETGNLTTAINLVARDMGCAFVPAEGARVCAHPGLVAFFDTGLPELRWSLVAFYRKDVYLSRFSRLFIDFLKQQL